MNDYRFTPGAEDDLFEIWRYIARDSVAARKQCGIRHLRCLLFSCSGAPERQPAQARHCPSSPFLDRPAVSKLCSRLPPGNSAPGNCSHPAWHARSQAAAQALKVPSQPVKMAIQPSHIYAFAALAAIVNVIEMKH
jgi:hypothetical protein